MTSSSPALVVSSRWGQAAKSSTAARGRRVSRPAVAGELLSAGAGPRSSRPNPSSARSSATLAGWGKQLQLPGPPLTHEVDHRPAGVAEPVGCLLVGQPVHEERAQRLVAAVVDLCRRGEPLGPIALW